MICYNDQAMTSINGFKSPTPLLYIETILNDDVVCAGLPYEFIDATWLYELSLKFPSICYCYNVHDDIYPLEESAQNFN